MLIPMIMPPYWRPGDLSIAANVVPGFAWTQVDLPGDEMIATSLDYEVLKCVTIGSRLSATYMIEAITPKRTRLGEGNFVLFRIDISDEAGDEVARLRLTAFRYTPEAGNES
jgi:hypothetical protein